MSKTLEEIINSPSLVRQSWLPTDVAVREVIAFEQRFGTKHLMLACHAALPSILSPELVNLIHLNFLEKKNIPWEAEVDLLLSPLCRPLDDGLYEVEPSIREVLLVELEDNFGWERPFYLAKFLQYYLAKKVGLKLRSELVQTQRWIAQAYLDPDSLVEEIKNTLDASLSQEGNRFGLPAQIQVVNILELLVEPLDATNQKKEYQYLVNDSRVLAQLIYEDEQKLEGKIEKQTLSLLSPFIQKHLVNLSREALNNLAYVLFETRQLKEAERTLFTAIEVLESIRTGLGDNDVYKVSIFEQQWRTYQLLQRVLIAQGQIATALEIAERGRTRALIELLMTRLTKGDKEPPPCLTIEQIQQIAREQNATLVEYSLIYDVLKTQDPQQVWESDLFIWVIQPTGAVNFRQVDLRPLWQEQNLSLTDLVGSARAAIGVPEGVQDAFIVDAAIGVPEGDRDAFVVDSCPVDSVDTQPLKQLHNLLIQPIYDILPQDGDAHVIFIPQKGLFLTPFAFLQDASGRYLIEQHTIRTVPSIQVLALTHRLRQSLPQPQMREALVVGNPTMPYLPRNMGEPLRQLRSLPGAEQEAKAIARLLNTEAITGHWGTKAVVMQRMPGARIIHLATHGLLDDMRGLGSAIALAPSGNDNGWLTAEEILKLELGAELIVLSSGYNTGQGRITGDEVIGLSCSLIAAGIPSVIVPLWAVPDTPTAFLMTAFYQNLKNNLDKAQALRQAMLMTMKQYPNPRAWAAFTLIGEAE